ncbi:MAG: alpha-1,2-fucosyltransferase [Verrucomicrobiota bacterium]
MKKVIVRIKGGLGNQLFCYAAARRLALVNKAELVIDNVTGFVRDRQYRRQYALDRFHIPVRKATPAERMEPLERYRRGLAKLIACHRPFPQRHYVEQEGNDFNARLLNFKVNGTVYLDGYWQDEKYFKDVEQTIRRDFQITPPNDLTNRNMAEHIRRCNAIAVHVRWFDLPGTRNPQHNTPASYYGRAVAEMEQRVSNPHFFLFSDDPVSARRLLGLPEERVTCIDHNHGDENAYADLWLMTTCKHLIIANSSFSWWGAWLSASPDRTVIAPISGFDSTGTIPSAWMLI